MEKDNHQIEMTYDLIWGLEIIDLKCPYKDKFEAVENFLRRPGDYLNPERYKELKEIISGSELGENSE